MPLVSPSSMYKTAGLSASSSTTYGQENATPSAYDEAYYYETSNNANQLLINDDCPSAPSYVPSQQSPSLSRLSKRLSTSEHSLRNKSVSTMTSTTTTSTKQTKALPAKFNQIAIEPVLAGQGAGNRGGASGQGPPTLPRRFNRPRPASPVSAIRVPDSAKIITHDNQCIEVKRPTTAFSLSSALPPAVPRPGSTPVMGVARALYYAKPHASALGTGVEYSKPATSQVYINGVHNNRCLSPVIHSSQMGTENLPSPRTLYIPATRRTETTTKHIIVSTETKRKKLTNEAGAQTENRETHATQTTPVEKEYEDIMMLKPIGRGLHNLEPDQQSFMRPTTPSAFARPYTPGAMMPVGYATLDGYHYHAGSSAAVSRSRSMQGIAGYPTMLRSPSVPAQDGIPATSPYCRQPLGAILPNNNQDCGTSGQVSLVPAQSGTQLNQDGGLRSRVVREQESEHTTTMHKEFRDGPFLMQTQGPTGPPQQYFAIDQSQQQQQGPIVTTPGSTLPRQTNGSEHAYSAVTRVPVQNQPQQQTQTSSISIQHPIHVDIYSGQATTTTSNQTEQHKQVSQTQTQQTSTETSSAKLEQAQATPRFPIQGGGASTNGSQSGTLPRSVNDSSKLWYRPNISRDEAITLLKSKQAGTFLIRDSNTFKGAYGLAIKVSQLPPNVQPKPGADPEAELVRHFLIERTAGGVRLKGCANEPVFPSLAALVYQHSVTPLALPCLLVLPSEQQQQQFSTTNGTLERNQRNLQQIQQQENSSTSLLDIGAACNVVYLGTIDCESLSGPRAVGLAVTQLLRQTQPESRSTQVHFKVNASGITLTDNIRRLFFRRHYPPQSVLFVGMDPEERKFSSANKSAPCDAIFGFIARRQPGQAAADNQCHVFAELDPSQPAQAIVDFINSHLLPLNNNNNNSNQ